MIAALAHVEGRKLLVHPAALVGDVLAVFGLTYFVLDTRDKAGVSWDDDAWTVSVGVFFMAVMVMIATNLASTRDRREDTEEQVDSLPAAHGERTGGLLVATLWAVPPMLVVLIAAAVYGQARTDLSTAEWMQMGTMAMIVVVFGTFGITLGIWAPTPFLAPVAAWALIVLTPSDESPEAWQVLTPLVDLRDAALVAWHTAYLGGVGLLLAALALVRRERSRRVAAVALVGAVVAVGSAIVLVPRACPAGGPCLF